MHNKPKFHIIKNIGYALAGMRYTVTQEKSFRTQLAVIALIAVGLFFAPISTLSKWILFASTWLVLIAEAFNSAIERVVDLVTQEHHPLAGQAKDIGAFGVFLAFCLTAMIWGIVLYGELVKS
ncbi:diacylglycerol kinase [Nitratifractor salsuginis]|uniref:Diacylglycerol kinase n=1 Tax=Nitratifractor salsuginis (strain DSM 16511 / JCM 12458 / E9I37-1) TaxID=749222 RepID=E6X0A7_NITSE|nr:diacylglycerol kinase [Nitratifractor salsuginis]ADV45696.1 diacylglycerol kinase [Nitratifractor salsuginis DSM 16511]